MNTEQVILIETDDVYTLVYQDRGQERRVTFFDWYSAQANYERRAQEAQEAQEAQSGQNGAGHEK